MSPWMAGGFGMFSTISSVQHYMITATADSEVAMAQPLLIPEQLGTHKHRCIYLPTQKRFIQLKQSMQLQQWHFKGGLLHSATDMAYSCENICTPVSIKNIRLHLWEYKFNIPASKLYTVPVKTFE